MLVNIHCRFEELKGSKLSFAEKMKKVSQEWEKVKKDKQGKVIFGLKVFLLDPIGYCRWASLGNRNILDIISSAKKSQLIFYNWG